MQSLLADIWKAPETSLEDNNIDDQTRYMLIDIHLTSSIMTIDELKKLLPTYLELNQVLEGIIDPKSYAKGDLKPQYMAFFPIVIQKILDKPGSFDDENLSRIIDHRLNMYRTRFPQVYELYEKIKGTEIMSA